MSQEAQAREFANLLLANWKTDPDLKGARLVCLLSTQEMETEVRQVGELPELEKDDLRATILHAAETEESGWEAEPEGLAYPLRYQEKFFGVCILYPQGDLHPLSTWEETIRGYIEQVGPLQVTGEEPPSLNSLVESIPERVPPQEDSANKLHWERSQARVEVPVQEELSAHLLVDHMPLF